MVLCVFVYLFPRREARRRRAGAPGLAPGGAQSAESAMREEKREEASAHFEKCSRIPSAKREQRASISDVD